MNLGQPVIKTTTVDRQTIALENTDAYNKLRSALVSGTVISPAQQDV